MKIRGTADKPGLEAPKMEKIWARQKSLLVWCEGPTYTEDGNKQKVDVGNIVELEPQVFGYKTERGIFGRPDFVPRVFCNDVAVFVSCIGWQRLIEVNFAA
jgi:hypothetical protein